MTTFEPHTAPITRIKPKPNPMARVSSYSARLGILLFPVILAPLAIVAGIIGYHQAPEGPEGAASRKHGKWGAIGGGIELFVIVALLRHAAGLL